MRERRATRPLPPSIRTTTALEPGGRDSRLAKELRNIFLFGFYPPPREGQGIPWNFPAGTGAYEPRNGNIPPYLLQTDGMRRRWAAFAIWLLLSAPALAPSIGSPIIVVVDAGHGGHDPGAVVEGIEEKDIVLDIALSVFELSRESPIQVVLTRSTDRYVDLKERVRFAERVGAVLYVSIHANYVSDTRVKGIEVYV
ncbi:TPA: N-acetylmuramoyl-L-alanine amidase, partial [Candidatus Micrarchaeota archaeon]|nr:N-acetylmuramoyl-L-alanine amidase [Candidatus Micrarchaeota archaeon]